jgi:arabinose-5-phosphate isomerase
MSKESITQNDFISHARQALTIEKDTIDQLIKDINHNFVTACETILACEGKVILIGMGKSGHIARKIAATFASTGTPAFFIHPSEATHGDMGMIDQKDIIIAISNSGETEEVLLVMDYAAKLQVPIISITARKHSRIAKRAKIHLFLNITHEACPLGLAPTASTTATLALGDALAISCLRARGFTKQDFINTHPSGSLGKDNRLVGEIIIGDINKLPIINNNSSLNDVLTTITEKGFGIGVVLNANKKISGIITDGDLRRMLQQQNDYNNLNSITAAEIMTARCISIHCNTTLSQALNIMSEYKITSLLVENEDQSFAGILHVHDLIKQSVQIKIKQPETEAC